MDDRVRDVLQRVADGVWDKRKTSLGELVQCKFCCRRPGFGHEEDCPTWVARQVLEEEDYPEDRIFSDKG